MTVTQCISTTRTEIVEVLEGCKFRDGDSLIDEELKKLRKDIVVFWNTRAEIACSQSSFIVYKTMPPAPHGKADGQVASRVMEAYIDIITTKKSDDPALGKIISDMEKGFLNKGWSFEMIRQDSYDPVNGRLVSCFVIQKRV